MGTGHVRGAKKRFAGMTKAQISAEMSRRASIRMKGLTKKQRVDIGHGLTAALQAKYNPDQIKQMRREKTLVRMARLSQSARNEIGKRLTAARKKKRSK